MLYCQKMIVSGRFVEIYEYGKMLSKDFKRVKKKSKPPPLIDSDNPPLEKYKRDDNVARTRSKLRRMINSNPDLNSFLTLTFSKNISNLNIANYEFKKFIQKLKFLYPQLKYIAVVEFQKRGAVHYHMLSNLPYIENLPTTISDMWGNGFIKINHIKHVDNIGAYVCKYLGKSTKESKLFGRKKYFSSKNVQEPSTLYDEKLIEKLVEFYNLKAVNPIYKASFDNNWVGEVKYSQYVLQNILDVSE